MADYKLSDLLDLFILQKLADAHYRAAGMPIGIIDALDGSVLVGAGWQDICVRYHRVNPISLLRCRESDDYIKGRLEMGTAGAYKCKNGLWDIGMPIVVDGYHLATMFLGQFFYEGEQRNREFFVRQARELGFDVDDYLVALDRVPVFSREKVDSIIEYDKALVGFIADLAGHAISRMESDKRVQDNERKFHAFFDQAYPFLWLLSTDCVVQEANQTALQLGALSEADVCGRTFWDTSWWAHSAELQETLRQALHRVVRGEIMRVEAFCDIMVGRRHYIDLSLKPIIDEAGRVVLLMAEGRDTTDARRAEQEIRQQYEFLKTLIDAMPYPVFFKDCHSRYLSCNRAFEALIGASRESIAGKTVHEIHPKDLADVYCRADDELLASQGKQVYEGSFQSSDGVRHDVVFHKATFTGPEGTVAGVVGAAVDITERKRAEKERQTLESQLAQARKMESVGRLAGGVAHDFNNLLSVIMGCAETALEDLDPSHPVREDLETIISAANRSVSVVRQLLAFARKQTIAPRILDLNLAVRDLLSMLRRLIGENIDLRWLPCTEPCMTRIDPSQIDQVLANLIVNARDAIPDVGRITIETAIAAIEAEYCETHPGVAPGDYIRLSVSDDGRGMDQETLSKAFEPFFTTKQLGEGTGLGLATVYGIAQQNQGFINAYSELGHGTSFALYIPQWRGEQERTSGDVPVFDPRGHETVLAVEDESVILKLVKTQLTTLGYTVLAAHTPADALRLAQEYQGEIHLLITDVIMPRMNGRELARCLLAICPKLKVLFMSGYTANVIAHHGVLEEGIQFLQKPFTKQDLAAKVRQALDA